ncbi:MAG: hypothetical protein GX260_01785 [Tissierellia bacterium]|nr:hypothetical protein [Bacillota bacterium]NLL22500.1 hypothetical protein [Tissierellia bacterium]
MKYKPLLLALLSLVIIATMFSCGGENAPVAPVAEETVSEPAVETIPEPPSEEEEIDYLSLYANILDRYYYLIAVNPDDFNDAEMGVFEATLGKEKEAALQTIGYSIEDISGDGIPELIIGAISEEKDSLFFGNEMYALFTLVNDRPQFVFEGWSRNSFQYAGEGSFFHWGSSGAMYTLFGMYSLTADATELIGNDFYFTFEKDESFQEIGFYHNTTGEMNKDVSEELSITDEEFWQIAADFEKEIQNMELIPFSMYEYTVEDLISANITLYRAEDKLDAFTSYDEFTADATQPQTGVLFVTDVPIDNFQVLALTLESIDDSGVATFSTETLYTLERLTPKRPFVVNLTFYGPIPSYGISYLDRDGIERVYSIDMSGEDGSLYLTEL